MAAGATLGYLFGSGDRKKAEQLMEENKRLADQLGIPPKEALQLTLANFVYQGDMSPAQAEAIMQDPSAWEGLEEDTSKQEEMLRRLTQRADQEGFDPQMQAEMAQLQHQAKTQEQAQRNAILRDAQSRGVQGSGLDYAARLQAQQGTGDAAHLAAMGALGGQDQRRLQALNSAAGMATDMRSQAANFMGNRANAMDNVSRFNADIRNQAAQANADRRQQAGMANWAQRQATADQNTGLRHQEEQARANAEKSYFDMQRAKIQGQTQANKASAGMHQQKAKQKTQLGSDLDKTATRVASGLA